MPVVAIVGAQWGDEGKGKIVDLFSEGADLVVRFQGGANAGHTISRKGCPLVLHLIPSGILHKQARCLIGPGVVLDPDSFFQEVADLQAAGIEVSSHLGLSGKAHVILPYHRAEEAFIEAARGGDRIGTTGRGIGPAYADRAARIGIRVFDLLDPPLFKERLSLCLRLKRGHGLTGDDASFEEIFNAYVEFGQRLRPFLADVETELREGCQRGSAILLEGAQGTLLDVDHGTYPYVTSSHTVSGGAVTSLGLPSSQINRVLSVVKAYTTRVGSGPFPTEVSGPLGEEMRERGKEYGATTGRPRRCGWIDLVALRHAIWVNGVDGLAITKLDALDSFETVKVCEAYRWRGKTLRHLPEEPAVWTEAEPIYQEFPGWKRSTLGTNRFEDLPGRAKRYLDVIVEGLGVELVLVSTGPDRGEEVCLRPLWGSTWDGGERWSRS